MSTLARPRTSKEKKEAKEKHILEGLSGFTGTTRYYRIGLPPIHITDGIKWLCDEAGAYWLAGVVASYQTEIRCRKHPFQVWRLLVSNHKAIVEAWTDTPGKSTRIIHQEIPCTDFPLDEFEWFFIDGVMLLKSEY